MRRSSKRRQDLNWSHPVVKVILFRIKSNCSRWSIAQRIVLLNFRLMPLHNYCRLESRFKATHWSNSAWLSRACLVRAAKFFPPGLPWCLPAQRWKFDEKGEGHVKFPPCQPKEWEGTTDRVAECKATRGAVFKSYVLRDNGWSREFRYQWSNAVYSCSVSLNLNAMASNFLKIFLPNLRAQRGK